MDEHDWLAEQFEANRTHLRAVAYRMLGSLSEADDAVQEAWLRLSRADTSGVENLGGWLTTVVARVCLDMLRSRKSRREESLGAHRARADREPRGWDRPRTRSAAGRLGRSRAARGARNAGARRAARVRAARHVRRALRRDRAHRGALPDRGQAAREPRAPPGAGSGRRFPTPISPASAKWSTPSSPPRAAVTSRRCSRCSTQMSCSAPTAPPWQRARRARSAARAPWPSRRSQRRAQFARPALVNGAVGVVVAPRGRLLLVLELHDRAREDRRNRRDRRPRAPPPARPGDAQRLTSFNRHGCGDL